MSVLACNEKMARHIYKKIVLVFILVLCMSLFAYKSTFVGTIQAEFPKPTDIPLTKRPELMQGRRHPTFNISYLKNNCSTKMDNVHSRNFDLRVFVFTYNRASSVRRLLSSLNMAKYENRSVMLEVWIDRSVDGKVDEDTLNVVEKFTFDPGIFRACVHEKHVGILGQWLIPWKPKADSNEIAVLLEDDMTVSPYFYKYLKMVHSKYRHMPKVNGFALQGISMKHNGEPGNVDIPSSEKVYLYPTLGTWGFSPNARNWINFLQWFEKSYCDTRFEPGVPNHVGTGWYQAFLKKNKEDGFWEMWHIYNSWNQEEWTLYPSFPGHKGLTFNWKENGLHYQGQSVTNEHEDKNHLLLEWKPEFEILPEVPIYVDNGGHILPRS